MYWELVEVARTAPTEPPEGARRFVLHRHRDGLGAHLDLRLESGDCLLGWRIAAESLEAGHWATEKMPHPTTWLEEDRDAQREDAGRYVWRDQDGLRRALVLFGPEATATLRFERCETPSVEDIRALTGLAREQGVALSELAGLAQDGLTARRESVARYCGLGRTLDGDGFDEAGWRGMLAGMDLRAIGARLAVLEARYDRAYPPAATSRPERLDEEAAEGRARADRALRIARSDA